MCGPFLIQFAIIIWKIKGETIVRDENMNEKNQQTQQKQQQ